MKLKMKHRRGELILTEKDVILDNDACFQLITQKYWNGYFQYCYELSSTTCKKLIKDGMLVLFDYPKSTNKKLKYYRLNTIKLDFMR